MFGDACVHAVPGQKKTDYHVLAQAMLQHCRF